MGPRWGIETSFRDIKDMRFGNGVVGDAGFESAASGPDVAAQCVGDCIVVVVGSGGGELGLRSVVKGEHGEISYALVVSSGVDVV